jgi:midasin (ATPase involved in ribosome maturation)
MVPPPAIINVSPLVMYFFYRGLVCSLLDPTSLSVNHVKKALRQAPLDNSNLSRQDSSHSDVVVNFTSLFNILQEIIIAMSQTESVLLTSATGSLRATVLEQLLSAGHRVNVVLQNSRRTSKRNMLSISNLAPSASLRFLT